ncbi:MAG: FAD-dependent oxidoreductase [Oscillospiraceae bacterium]|nr:FAD-dependent oxidoreductase [Oscillospiraceae bacterium]
MQHTNARRTEDVPVRYSTDVLVVGGGLAGVCAAVSAAETGANVILLERNGRGGGNFTNSFVGTFCGYHIVEDEAYKLICGGLGERVFNHLVQENALGRYITYAKVPVIPFDIPVLTRFLDQMLMDAGVKVLFRQLVSDVVVEDNRVASVVVTDKSGQYSIACKAVIDCTGDGDVAFMAGVPLLEDGGQIQFPSMIFHMGGINVEEASKTTKKELAEYQRQAVESGEFDLPRRDGTVSLLPRLGMAQANMGRIKIGDRPIDVFNPEELSWGEMEGRRQSFMYLDFLKKYVPGYENAYICGLPNTVGIRESRRMQGQYVLTKEDFLAAQKFEDGIACSSWPVEFHKAGALTEWVYLPEGEYIEVPMRSLIPEEIENLLFAGRCLSADQTSHAAVRCGPVCMSMGEAAGLAAAELAETGGKAQEIDGGKIRQAMKARGAHFLKDA